MTPFRALRQRIGWSVDVTAERLGLSSAREALRWDNGTAEPPDRVLDGMRATAEAVESVAHLLGGPEK